MAKIYQIVWNITRHINEVCRTEGVKNGLEELKKVFEGDLKELEKRLTNE